MHESLFNGLKALKELKLKFDNDEQKLSPNLLSDQTE